VRLFFASFLSPEVKNSQEKFSFAYLSASYSFLRDSILQAIHKRKLTGVNKIQNAIIPI
jgi:hypothetical protein